MLFPALSVSAAKAENFMLDDGKTGRLYVEPVSRSLYSIRRQKIILKTVKWIMSCTVLGRQYQKCM